MYFNTGDCMRENNRKKLWLYISMIPYVYVLVMCIYHAIFGYSYEHIRWEPDYGLDGALAFVLDFWDDLIIEFDYKLLVVVMCVCYQIYYFVSNKQGKPKKDTINKEDKKRKRINLKKIFFVISIACWIIYFMIGIYAYFTGIDTGLFYTNMVYGMEAFKSALVLYGFAFSFIPVLPITLIYIIIYLVVKHKNKKDSSNIFTAKNVKKI